MSQAKLREALTGGGSSQKDKGPPVADGVLSVEPESSEAIEWRTRRSVIDTIASCSKFLDEEDDEQQPGDLYGKFTWKINKFSELNKRELRSATFEVGSYKWYILVYPQGCDVANHLSLFLCVADYDKLLPGWAHFAQFTIAVVNKDPKKSKYSDTLHRFCKKEHDWGWKKFMELSKVMEGFTPQDSLVIKAQVQIIRDRPTHPFKCLDAQYRRELVRVYLTNVEGICRRFMEERKESLRRLLNDGFRRFWQSLTPMQQLERTQGRMDVVLKGLVKKFLNEKEVTSTLVMDAMYCGCKLLEEAGHAFLLAAQQAQQHPWGGVLIDSQRGTFFFAGEALAVLERVVEEVVPPFTPDPKADTTVLRHAQESDDYTRDSMERDERRLCDLGRRTVEIFAASYVASNLMEVAWREDDVLRRQDELIKEEERAERAEQLRRAAKAEAEKEKRARKKEKQKQKKEAERARREAEEAERAQREEERRAEQERRNREAEDRRRALEEQREEDRSRAKQAQQQEQQARRKAASSVKAVRQQQAREEKAASSLQPLQLPVQWRAAAGSAEQLCQPGSSAREQQGAWHGAGAAAEHNAEQASSSYAALASPAGSGAPPPDFEDSEGLASMANGGSRWGEGGEEGEGEREGPSQAWQYSTAASSTGCSTMQNSVATSRAATPEGPYGLRPQQHPSAGTSARTAGSTLSTVSGSDVSAEDEAESLRGQVRWLQDALSLKEGTIRELQERVAELELQLQLADPSGSASQPGAAGPGARQPSTASSAGEWGEGHGGAQGAEASNGVHPPRPAPAENGYPSAAAAHPGAAKAVVAQRQGSGPSGTAGSATQRAGQAQRPQAPSEATASGQQLAAHSRAGVALPPSAAILASASLQHAQQGPQQAQQGSSRAMPRQQSAPLLGSARQGNPGPAVQPQPQAVPAQGRARGKGGAAGAAAAPAAAAPVGTSQVPQFSPALPAGAGAQRPAQQPFTGRGGVAVVKAPTPARAVAAGPCTGGGIFGPAPVGVLPAQQQHLPGGAVAPPRGLVPAGGVRPPPPPPPPSLGVSAQQQDGGLFHGRLPPQTNSPYSSPAPPAKGLHHPPAAADSPGLDDFAHMGLITDLLD